MKRTEDRAPASPLRRHAIEVLLALGGVATLGALGFAFRSKRTKVGPSRSPWLRIREGVIGSDNPGEPPVLWLALATLSQSRRSSLLDDIEAAMASAEARGNPLLVDLVEDDVVDVFRRNQAWLLPLCTAASALFAPFYGAPDGFQVQALPRMAPRAPGDIPAWKSEPEGTRERRARFLAWPVSRSLIVRTRDKESARRLETDLRSVCMQSESAVALVLDRRLLDGKSPEPRLDDVFVRLSKAQKRIQAGDDLPLLPVAPAAGSPISPWVALEEGELLVVPKLSALSPALRFESEVMNLLRGTDSDLIPRTPV